MNNDMLSNVVKSYLEAHPAEAQATLSGTSVLSERARRWFDALSPEEQDKALAGTK